MTSRQRGQREPGIKWLLEFGRGIALRGILTNHVSTPAKALRASMHRGVENRTQTLPGRWFATLAWARGAAAVQPMEFFFVGVATATEVAYYAYIYSVVPAARYQRVTGYCRSATLLGSAAGSPSGRPPVTVASVPPRRLVYATLASAAVAFAAPWFPPTACG
ncbi:hypothetical protein CRUP_009551, partial [Coryphaenoides rupestris]